MENENNEQQGKIETFDEREFFMAEIYPKMEELLKLCHERGIPILMFAIHKQTEEGFDSAVLSSVNNRNGQAVHDLSNCAKILSSPMNFFKSFILKMLAVKIEE